MFDKGDKVRCVHFHGGPLMVVISTTSAAVQCFWFDKNDAPQERYFRPEDVRKEEAKAVDDGPTIFGRRRQ